MSQQKQDITHLRQRLAQSNIIVDATRRFASTLDSSEIKLALFEAVFQIAGAQQIALHLVREKGLQSHICHPVEGFRMETAVLPPEATAFRIYEETELVLWKRDDDNHDDPPVCIKTIRQFDSYLALPLKSADKVVGVVEAFNLLEPKNAAQLADLLVEITGAASLAIYNGILYQEAQYEIAERKRIEEKIAIDLRNQTVMTEILQIATANDINELLQQVLDEILELPWLSIKPQGGIFLKESDASVLKLVAHRNFAPQLQTLCARVPFGRCLCGRAAATREIQFANCVDDNHETSFEGMAPHGHYNLPLITDDNQIIGVMVFYLEHGHQRDENEVAFLESVGHTLANIIQRMQMNAALQEHEEELQILLELSPNAIGLVNSQTGLFESVNVGAERLYGLTAEELLKVGPVHVSPELQPDGRPSGERAQAKIKEALDGDRPSFEWMHINAVGEEIPCEINLVGLPGTRSQLVRFSARDITERKQAESALHQSEERFRTLFDKSADAYLIIEDSIFTDCNQTTVEMLRASSKEEVIMLHPSKLSPEQQPDGRLSGEKADEMMRLALEKGEHRFEWMHRRTNGEDFPVAVALTSISLDDKDVILTTWRDITASKQADDIIAKRAAELQTVAEVSMTVATARNTSQLLQEVVDLTKSKFDFYHTHIYLLSEGHDTLFLTAGADKIGRQMVAEGLTIPLDQEQSLVAQVARTAQGITENDVRANPAFLPHPLLPETRSEMAVPMIVGDRVIGVLDVQANENNYFTEQDVAIQTTLAAQIAIALENAHSLEQAQEAVANMDELTRRLTREGWQEYLDDLPAEEAGFIYDASQLDPVLPVTEATAALSANGSDTEAARSLAYEIKVHGETIGQLSVTPDEAEEQVDAEMVEIIAAVSEQLGTRIENLRLNEQTQTALAETEVLYNASADLNTSQTYQEVLAAFRKHSVLSMGSTDISINYFDQTWTDSKMPKWIEVLARWSELPSEAVTNRYPLSAFPSANKLLNPDSVTFIRDFDNDPWVDERMRTLYVEQLGAKSAMFVPLVVGTQWIGCIIATFPDLIDFSEAEIRRLMVLSQQAAIVVENAQNFEQEQARAKREQVLREITERVRGSV
ncbi:MAG: GAF domain-containing protein, partial [Chloroflexi bacterium]|nr:GAF domain-containing protein [Chloroflexota bacterium]